jgi:hypothetical protein
LSVINKGKRRKGAAPDFQVCEVREPERRALLHLNLGWFQGGARHPGFQSIARILNEEIELLGVQQEVTHSAQLTISECHSIQNKAKTKQNKAKQSKSKNKVKCRKPTSKYGKISARPFNCFLPPSDMLRSTA